MTREEAMRQLGLLQESAPVQQGMTREQAMRELGLLKEPATSPIDPQVASAMEQSEDIPQQPQQMAPMAGVPTGGFNFEIPNYNPTEGRQKFSDTLLDIMKEHTGELYAERGMERATDLEGVGFGTRYSAMGADINKAAKIYGKAFKEATGEDAGVRLADDGKGIVMTDPRDGVEHYIPNVPSITNMATILGEEAVITALLTSLTGTGGAARLALKYPKLTQGLKFLLVTNLLQVKRVKRWLWSTSVRKHRRWLAGVM